MHQTVFARQNGDEGPEVDDARHLAGVDRTHFSFGGNRQHAINSGVTRLGIGAVDAHGTVIFDIDLGFGFFADAANSRAAFTDNVADFVGVDFQRRHARCVS